MSEQDIYAQVNAEWACRDSSSYADGYAEGAADARAGRKLAGSLLSSMPPAWCEGYRAGHGDTTQAWPS